MASRLRRNARHRREEAEAPAAEPAVRSSPPHPALPTTQPPCILILGQANFLGLGILCFGAALGVTWYNKRQQAEHGHAHAHGADEQYRPHPARSPAQGAPCGATTRCFNRPGRLRRRCLLQLARPRPRRP